MVAPCDKYQGLVIGPDGQTVTNPYGILPTLNDYEEWRAVVGDLIARAEAELGRLFDLFGALTPADADPVDALRVRFDQLGTALSQGFSFNDLTWAPAIVSMVTLGRDAACQIGVVEARIVEMGGEPNDIPAAPKPGASSSKGGLGGGKGMGLGLVLLLGAFMLSRD